LPDSLIVLSKRTAAQIGFVKSKAELLPASFPGLDSLAVKLKRYPFIQVEINGHTDYIGDSTNNAKLSLKRAQAVASFLEEKGIEARRLKVQGFGGRFPLSLIDTEAEHNRNRRVEIKLYR
jgi:outer membrane protein OmpA-like peptidoglycan-associated protein